MSSIHLLLIAFASVWAGTVRGLAGFGGPLLLIPILNLYFPPVTTVVAVLVADTLASVQLLPDAWRNATARTVKLLIVGSLLTIPAGSALLVLTDPVLMKRCISSAILILAIVVLLGWRYPRPLSASGYVGVGALAGIVMGATGIAAVVPLFLSAGQESAAQMRAHFILWVFVASLWVCLSLGVTALPRGETLIVIGLLLPTYGFGVFIGKTLIQHFSDVNLRRSVLLLVITVSLFGLLS